MAVDPSMFVYDDRYIVNNTVAQVAALHGDGSASFGAPVSPGNVMFSEGGNLDIRAFATSSYLPASPSGCDSGRATATGGAGSSAGGPGLFLDINNYLVAYYNQDAGTAYIEAYFGGVQYLTSFESVSTLTYVFFTIEPHVNSGVLSSTIRLFGDSGGGPSEVISIDIPGVVDSTWLHIFALGPIATSSQESLTNWQTASVNVLTSFLPFVVRFGGEDAVSNGWANNVMVPAFSSYYADEAGQNWQMYSADGSPWTFYQTSSPERKVFLTGASPYSWDGATSLLVKPADAAWNDNGGTPYSPQPALGLGLFEAVPIALGAGSISNVSHTSSSVTNSWTAGTGNLGTVTGKMQRSPHSANTWTDVGGATSSPATDSGRSASTTYDYRTLYSDGFSTAVASNTIAVTTDAAPPVSRGKAFFFGLEP